MATSSAQVDLSEYSTASKNQWATGNCVGFSNIGAMEARFNHKFCESGAMNAFRRDHYCDRFDAIRAEKNPLFFFNQHWGNWASQTKIHLGHFKEVDLSEHYFLHRQFTQNTTAPGSNHESGNLPNFLHGLDLTTGGPLVHFSLPEEEHAPYFANNEFWSANGNSMTNFLNNENINQSRIDLVEFSQTPVSSYLPGSPFHVPFIPLASRNNAKFTISEYVFGSMQGSAEQRIRFLERVLYSGYEIALHGAVPGHSMLLVGYDRARRIFFFKDHYLDWPTAPYETVARADSYTAVLDVEYDGSASKEEMWLGQWELEMGNDVGLLTIRRTRQPTNSFYQVAPTNNFTNAHLVEMPKDKWARIGTYADSRGYTYAAFGLLGADGDDGTMSIWVDTSRPDPGPHTVAEHRAGFQVSDGVMSVELKKSPHDIHFMAVGKMKKNGVRYPVQMVRPKF